MALPSTAPQTERIRLGVSPNRVNKDVAEGVRVKFCKQDQTEDACWTLGAFDVRPMTEADIGRAIIREGHAITVAACKGNWRKEANFTSSQIMGADYDYGPDLDGVRKLPFGEYSFLIYRTPSYTVDAPRTRSLFILDKPITSAADYKRLLKRLLYALSQRVRLDTSCKDAARIFYGSKDAGFDFKAGARLPVAMLEALPPHPDELAAEREAERRATTPYVRPTGTFADGYGADLKAAKLADLYNAGKGDRHPTLKNVARFVIGRQKGGWPAYANADAEIRDAAQTAGLPRHEVDSYIAWCHANIAGDPFEAPATRLEPIYKPAPARTEQRRQRGDEWGAQIGVNAFGAQGEAILYRITRTAWARGGAVETIDDLIEWQPAAGISASRKTLERYVKNAHSEAGTLLTPDFTADTMGVNFVWRTDSELDALYRERAAVYCEVGAFPATSQNRTNATTGETYTAEPIPAQLKPEALQSIGLSAAVAKQASDALAELPFDEKTRNRRWGANKYATARFEKICRLLESSQVIPLPEDMEIRTEGDLKRAQARAWHMAGVANFQTKAEQQFALGIASKNTLKQVLADAGVECEEVIEYKVIQAGEDVGQQVQKMRRDKQQWARSYRAIDENGEPVERGIYRRADVEDARAKGLTIEIAYQGPHKHHIVERPTQPYVSPNRSTARTSTACLKPRRPAIPRGHYPREWVAGQLRLHYRVLFGREPREDATPLELIEAVTGRPFDRAASNPILSMAIELGATITRREVRV